MANPDQKTILIDNAYEELKNICINLQKDTDVSNLEVKNLLNMIMNEFEEKWRHKISFGLGKVINFLELPFSKNYSILIYYFFNNIIFIISHF